MPLGTDFKYTTMRHRRGETHDIASGQNLFLREVFSKTTASTTTELSGLSQEMIILISLEAKIRRKMFRSIIVSN